MRDLLAMFSCTGRSCLKSTKGYQAYTKQKAHIPFKPFMAHETSVALIPPDSAWPPIQDARMLVQDKGLWRWPPHANLLYPFVAPAEFEVTSSLDNRNIDAHDTSLLTSRCPLPPPPPSPPLACATVSGRGARKCRSVSRAL